jgi:thiol-disulfide isomerase/thioredoxin
VSDCREVMTFPVRFLIFLTSSLILVSGLLTCSTKNLLKSEKTGSIYVTSIPSGADILVDQTLKGKTTPDTIYDVGVGDHVVSVMLTGYISSPDSKVIKVNEDETTEAEFTLLETSKGSLKVNSNVNEATICLDSEPTLEVTPHVFFNSIPVGTHIISVFKEGYASDDPTKEIVEISTGDTVEVDFALSPADVGQVVGNITADFELEDDYGFLHRLYAYRGFVVMINFWAIDCSNCMKELPYLQEIYEDYSTDSLVIFGLNYHDGFDVIGQVRVDKGLTFILLQDMGGLVKDDYGLLGTPVTIILDRGGRIYFYWGGFQNPAVANKFREKLDELFGK